MFKQILAATDGSDNSFEALRVACRLAASNPGSKLHVITAFHALTPAAMVELTEDLPDEFKGVLHAGYAAERTLTEARRIVAAAGVTATFDDIQDDPTDAIIESAEKLGADLIVMGSRGEGMAKRILHGSVSTKVIHHAPCSVMVIKQPF